MKSTKLQIAVLPDTKARLNEIARDKRTPLNHLIVMGDSEVMGILRADLQARHKDSEKGIDG